YRDANGLLWIKKGTTIYARACSDSIYIIDSKLENVQTDGVFQFNLKQTDEKENVEQESVYVQEEYFVDGEAPQATFQAAGTSQNGIVYTSGLCTVSISVEPDGKSGLKSVSYKVVTSDLNGTVSDTAMSESWIAGKSYMDIQISTEGLYRVYVRTEDMVGNVAYSGSTVICVDSQKPEITVSGVGDQTANSGSVELRVSCSDTSYKAGSLQVSISGVNQGNSPGIKQEGSDEKGAWVEFYDFPEMKNYDDVYVMTVTAEDLSGNISEKTISFSVNRFGSVYDLSMGTREALSQYFLAEAKDIVFYESNIDYVGESVIYCRKNGILRELIKNKDYQVTMEGTAESWKRYCYTVPSEYFSQEGIYEILLASEDAANNQSDTDIAQERVIFVLDWTSPTCTISGIQNGGIYDADNVTIYVTPSDNMTLKSLKVYHNSELFLEDTNQPENEESVKMVLEADSEWQTVQVWLCDMAGNEYWSDELAVFVCRDIQDVPEYIKSKKSAMELALDEKLSGAEEALGDDHENFSVANISMQTKDMDEDCGEETTTNTAQSQDDVIINDGNSSTALVSADAPKTASENGEINVYMQRKVFGWVILLAGMGLFIITIVVLRCSRHLSRRKRFK
ncbi:MAG: Ig-like domain-containing protein, partial [Lachnospiraceae bacterium]|nr:Ig-like domain-containing protein [Lachnospiraceae bacterium]